MGRESTVTKVPARVIVATEVVKVLKGKIARHVQAIASAAPTKYVAVAVNASVTTSVLRGRRSVITIPKSRPARRSPGVGYGVQPRRVALE